MKIYHYFKNFIKEKISQKYRLKTIAEAKDYFLEEIKQNELMTKKHKRVSLTLNYIDHLPIVISTVTGRVSISAFASLIGIPIGNTNLTIRLKICPINLGIKNDKLIIKKKKNKHDKIVLLAKSKLYSIEVVISKALIDSIISHDESFLTNNVQKNIIIWKKKSRPNQFIETFCLFIKQCFHIVWSVEKIQRVKIQKLQGEKYGTVMLLPKCAVCDSLGIKTPLSKILLVGPLFLYRCYQVNIRYKMNEIVNKLLLAEDKFMPEMHSRQSGFTYSACGPFTKIKEGIQKIKETGDSRYIYQN